MASCFLGSMKSTLIPTPPKPGVFTSPVPLISGSATPLLTCTGWSCWELIHCKARICACLRSPDPLSIPYHLTCDEVPKPGNRWCHAWLPRRGPALTGQPQPRAAGREQGGNARERAILRHRAGEDRQEMEQAECVPPPSLARRWLRPKFKGPQGEGAGWLGRGRIEKETTQVENGA